MPEPRYKKYPHLYAYNSTTKKHILKSSDLYKNLNRSAPQTLVETKSMFPDPIEPPIELPLAPAPEVPSPAVHIGDPLPEPPKPHPDYEREQMQARVRELIKEEI